MERQDAGVHSHGGAILTERSVIQLPVNHTPFSFDGQVAIVTGASAGIGQAIAAKLLRGGASVLITSRDADRLQRAIEALRQHEVRRGRVEGVCCDLCCEESPAWLVEEVVTRFGRLNLLVNNVGGLTVAPIDSIGVSDCVETMTLNLYTAVGCCRAAVPELRGQGGGAILNVCSVSATHPASSVGFYPVAKAALSMYTRCLAAALAPDGIRVNALSPGPVDTSVWDRLAGSNADTWRSTMASRTALGRLGHPDEIARLAAYLLSSEAAWVTGSEMIIDGGMLLR